MRRSYTLLPLALSSSIWVACGSSSTSTPPPQDSGSPDTGVAETTADVPDKDVDAGPTVPPGAEEACRAYHEILCGAWEKCNPVLFPSYIGDHATCVARGTKACMAGFDDPGMGSTPDGLKACAASIATLTCVQYFRLTGENGVPVTPECGALRKGTLPVGAACGSNLQCASTYCEIVGDALCGKCTERSAKGASCFSTHPNSCEPGTVCLGAKCVAYNEVGAACDDTTPCHADLACVSGKCAARLKDGDACEAYKYQCEWNHWCNSDTLVCEPLKFGKLGDACGLVSGGGYTLCDATTRCNITNKATYTGKCQALAKLGEACTFATQCEYPELCASSTCQYRDPGVLCK